MITDKEIIKQFNKLGITKYEALAYLTLLRSGKSYGGEISKNSGVPSSKIYETLNRLVEKGLAHPAHGNPVCYNALPLQDFLSNKQNEYKRIFDFLEASKEHVVERGSVELLWYLTGRDQLIDKAREYIDNATSQIWISLWPEEADELKGNLIKAHQRDVEIISIQFNGLNLDIGKAYRHISGPQIRKRHGYELFLLVDESSGMFMFLEKMHGWKGFYTSSMGICRIIKNYISHDIYCNRMLTENENFMSVNYGKQFERLLNI